MLLLLLLASGRGFVFLVCAGRGGGGIEARRELEVTEGPDMTCLKA